MSEYFRVSDKVCKSSVIEEINHDISNAERDISDIHNDILALNSPRNCFLYGDSLERFEKQLVTINQSLVKLNEKLSYFKSGLEEIENSSSQQINAIEIPNIHSSELHNVEFSIPIDSLGQQNTNLSNLTGQSSTNTGLGVQQQEGQSNVEQETMTEKLQENNDELSLSTDGELSSDNNQFENETSDDIYNIEFDDNTDFSFSEPKIKEDASILNSSKVNNKESDGGLNTATIGGLAAAIGAIGAGAAFYVNNKKDEEKDDNSQRNEGE